MPASMLRRSNSPSAMPCRSAAVLDDYERLELDVYEVALMEVHEPLEAEAYETEWAVGGHNLTKRDRWSARPSASVLPAQAAVFTLQNFVDG